MRNLLLILALIFTGVSVQAQQSPIYVKSVTLKAGTNVDLSFLQNAKMIRITNNVVQPTKGYGLLLFQNSIFVFSKSARIDKNEKRRSAKNFYEKILKDLDEENPFGPGGLENHDGKTTIGDAKYVSCRAIDCSPCSWTSWGGKDDVYQCAGCDKCEAFAQTKELSLSGYNNRQNEYIAM